MSATDYSCVYKNTLQDRLHYSQQTPSPRTPHCVTKLDWGHGPNMRLCHDAHSQLDKELLKLFVLASFVNFESRSGVMFKFLSPGLSSGAIKSVLFHTFDLADFENGEGRDIRQQILGHWDTQTGLTRMQCPPQIAHGNCSSTTG